ncbi:MAG: DNA topoisomerase (ATP-hydrolyzing) subunit A [Clostridia bacterium]|nr:DNA topoisomerase (ATP-hydrolyzing) subunit A [Clostridia bacterium]
MAKKKSNTPLPEAAEREPVITLQPITETIEKNYMPYVMTVIISRAIPEIDGFKPSHRKLLYAMYDMGLLNNAPYTKSATVVGKAMHLNPHGDGAIYETLVRLTRGNEALLHPFIDSKGSFGKVYSRDMAYAASRYTNVRLDPICNEIFRGIEKNAVDMVPNYDNTTTEPVLLPTSFPNVLVSPNIGIAVGMASNICSFNLAEICDGTSALLSDPKMDLNAFMDIVKAPDFSTGASHLYTRADLKEHYRTGRGSFRLRARYSYDKKENCIDILQIPYSTSLEAIMKRLSDLVKEGKLKEITDFRDEIDVNGFKLTIDLRRGTNPELLMKKLYKLTPLEDEFACNFNILIGNAPRQMGVMEILGEWIKFRIGCIRRELTFDLEKKKEKLHLLLGLGKILLDIDKAIAIVRGTENDNDVVPNLMKGFSIDKVQAEYIADIKLRNLNREYIINRIKEIEDLQKEIADLEATIASDTRIKKVIAKQLKEVKTKYGKPRVTQLVYDEDIEEYDEEEHIENFPVKLIFSREGYFKKITMASLRGNDEQKFKDGDSLRSEEDSENINELLFFSDKAQVYKAKVSDFEPAKASVLGDYVPAKLGFDSGERCIAMKSFRNLDEDRGTFVFLFENGKGVQIPASAYSTKSNRRKLTGAYSDASPCVGIFYLADGENKDILMLSSANKGIVFSSSLIPVKTTRSSAGVALMTLKAGMTVTAAETDFAGKLPENVRLKKTKLPSAGTSLPDDFSL